MNDGTTRSLVINNLKIDDSGTYLCKNQLNLLQFFEFNIKVKGMHKKLNLKTNRILSFIRLLDCSDI